MLLIFKPSGATKASPEMAINLEALLQENLGATVLKAKSDISDASIPFVHSLPSVRKGDEIVIAGQGCANTLLANLFSLWDRGVVFKIKRQHFLLSGHDLHRTRQTIESFFGKSIWEDR